MRAGRIQVSGGGVETGWWGPEPLEAPTLVLLHEGLGSVALWRDVPARLAAATGWGVFAYSRFGYGGSDGTPLPRPMDYMQREAQVVLPEVLRAAGVRNAVLVGHSDGGSIAAVYAGSGSFVSASAVGLSDVSRVGLARPSTTSSDPVSQALGGRAWPLRHQDRRSAGCDFPPFVMPALDPGTPTTDGVRGGPRAKPGDDGMGVGRREKTPRPSLAYPDAYGDKPDNDTGGEGREPTLLGLVTIAAHFIVEDLNIDSIRRIKADYDTGSLRQRLSRYHRDVDIAFRGWNDAWLDPRFREFDITGFLANIEVPILALQGADDPYGSDEQLRIIQANVTAPMAIQSIAGAGHSPHLEAADDTLAAIVNFITNLPRGFAT